MDNDSTYYTSEITASPSIGLTPGVLPEAATPRARACSHTGVSTNYAPTRTSKEDTHHWYTLRATYGREKMASDYIAANGGTVFCPMVTVTKLVNGKRRHKQVSRLPNIFFIYGTADEVKHFVYDNVKLPFLRFYYKHTHHGSTILREPLIVPDRQMESLRIICELEMERDVILLQEEIRKFKTGDRVRVVGGDFQGVEGVVARFQGQQRVGLVLDSLLTAVTAYVPNAFIEKIDAEP